MSHPLTLFHLKDENVENEEKLLKLTESLCAVQSDWTIFWRYRQLIFTKRVDRVNSVVKKRESGETLLTDDIEKQDDQVEKSEENDEKATFINQLKDELYLTYRVLVQSPKSYVTWAHRRFCLRTLMSCDHVVGAEYVEKEIKLTETMLTAMTETQVEDQGRNFHCWDHRRLVLKMGTDFIDRVFTIWIHPGLHGPNGPNRSVMLLAQVQSVGTSVKFAKIRRIPSIMSSN